MSEPILSVRDLRVRFATKRGVAEAVNRISYELHAGETLAIVGESGSGKSVSVMALMRLLQEPPALVSGSVVFQGRDLLKATDHEMRSIRGRRIAMIFQDPMTSLNPVRTIGYQLIEPLTLHLDHSRAEARRRAIDLLDMVGMSSPEVRIDEYPHQLSGGMRQRVMIAMALACDPDILIADEPTTALDVTIQAQVTELVADLQQRLKMAVIWITHDLAVVAGTADRVMVMYGGGVVEEAVANDLFQAPQHPYTERLLRSLPVFGSERPERLETIPGLPPDPVDMPSGCPFALRCERANADSCQTINPQLEPEVGSHRTACHHPLGVKL